MSSAEAELSLFALVLRMLPTVVNSQTNLVSCNCATIIHEDNLGAKQIAESGNFKGRSKHFELRWRFLHHYINRGIVSIKAIKRELQLADLGTAPRGYPQLQTMGAVIHGEI